MSEQLRPRARQADQANNVVLQDRKPDENDMNPDRALVERAADLIIDSTDVIVVTELRSPETYRDAARRSKERQRSRQPRRRPRRRPV